MASKKGEVDIQLRAKELGLEIDNLATSIESEFYQAIEDTANAAYASIIADAQKQLNSQRQDYLKALKFDRIGENSYVISLDGDWANKLESGYPSYDMKQGMLNSSKTVGVGSRAGEPWVQKNKKGKKFAHVPFEHQPHSKAPKGASDLGQAIKMLEAKNKSGRKQKLTTIFKDPSGKPLQGKVASVRDTGIPQLDGITKFQKTYTNDAGKETTQSIYMTWRTVGEDSDGWIHPGFSGIKAFDEAEMWAAKEIDNILKSFLG